MTPMKHLWVTALFLLVLALPPTAQAAETATGSSSHLLTLSGIDMVIVVLYFIVVLAIGFYLKRHTSTGEDFFMAGRQGNCM
ncbi:MAG: hypothetical protein A2Y77_13165 [Planctomycetes bacterium RBG_13_62_9]|nr:MAG: hypothetical protein A2Y77_13165 [Planctomycetes bacterium RBG_13_62_9]